MNDFLDGAKPVAQVATPPPAPGEFLANAKPVQAPPAKEGFWHSLAAQFGVTPEQLQAESNESIGQRIREHAFGPAQGVITGLYNQVKQSVSDVMQARQASAGGNRAEGFQHLVHAVPFVGPALVKGGDQTPADARDSYGKRLVDTATDPGTMGTILGASIQAAPIVAGGIEKIGKVAPPSQLAATELARSNFLDEEDQWAQGTDIPEPKPYTEGSVEGPLNRSAGGRILSRAASPVQAAADVAKRSPTAAADGVANAASSARQYLRPKSSPAIVPPIEFQAQKIAQSILPPGGIKPELVKSIQSEAPAVVDYARRTGNPLNTQAEGLKAAQGVAIEGLEHYKDNILAPIADKPVVLDPENSSLGAKATIGEVDAKITELNHQLDTSKTASAGQTLDKVAASKISDEVAYLRKQLYSSLESNTGISADHLQEMREGYGGEFSLANQLEAAQNARLTRTGQLSQGQQGIALKRPSILEVPGQVVQAVRGGEQAIADRQFSAAIKRVQPQAPSRPVPQITPPSEAESASEAEQGRTQQLTTQSNSERWAQQGMQKMLQHIQANPSRLNFNDIDKLSGTPTGRQLLIQASDLTPGSAIMKSIENKMKVLVGK